MSKSATTHTNATTERGKSASRAAARKTKAKLSVGPTNDSFEQEADRAASAVTSPAAVPAAASGAAASGVQRAPILSRRVQRKGMEEKKEPQAKLQRQEEEPQAKLQRQEEEPQAKLQRQEEEPQAKLQRQEEEPQAKLQRQEEEPQAKREPQEELPTLDRVAEQLFDSKGKGQPLPDAVRAEMEAGFGADFRDVRVHTGIDAETMSREIRAQAFTHGKDVFFNAGKFEPETARGKTLLAHELTHVVQQGAAEQTTPERPARWKPGTAERSVSTENAPRTPATSRRWDRELEEDPREP